MRLLRRWISESIELVFALAVAVVAMQAPAFTREYAGVLHQVAQEAWRDIEQRKASARQFYGIAAAEDDAFVAALRGFEPSNAQTLALALDKARALDGAYRRIAEASAMVQPVVAMADASEDPAGYKAAIWRRLLESYALQVDLSGAAAAYGLIGLVVGSLIAQFLLALGHWTLLLPFRRKARA